jgi:catalase
LSQMNTVKDSIKSRRVAVLVAPGFDGAQLQTVKAGLEARGAHPDIVSLALGLVKATDGTPVPVDKISQVAASVQYDAVFVPGGAASVEALRQMPEVGVFLAEALRHGKAVGVTGEAVQLLADALGREPGAKRDGNDGAAAAGSLGIIAAADGSNLAAFVDQFSSAIAQHRFPEREGERGGIGASRNGAG